MATEIELTIKGDVTRLRLEPGDKIIAHVRRKLTTKDHDELRALICKAFPGNEVFIVDESIDLKVWRPEGIDAHRDHGDETDAPDAA